MNESAEVLLWGKKIGVVSKRDGEPFVRFAYDGEFRDSGLEPSPVTMPVLETLYTFPDLPYRSFHGLPGLLSDSVPDKFGNAVIDVWLRSQNRSVDSLTPIERLCYTGSRGMGALEYRPTLFKEGDTVEAIRVEALARLADDVLRLRQDASAELVPDMKKFASILRVGSSAGGAGRCRTAAHAPHAIAAVSTSAAAAKAIFLNGFLRASRTVNDACAVLPQ